MDDSIEVRDRELLRAELHAWRAEDALEADCEELMAERRAKAHRGRRRAPTQNAYYRSLEKARLDREREREVFLELRSRAPGQGNARAVACNRADDADSSAWSRLGTRSSEVADLRMLRAEVERLKAADLELEASLLTPCRDQRERGRRVQQVKQAREDLRARREWIRGVLAARERGQRSLVTRSERRRARMAAHLAKKDRAGHLVEPALGGTGTRDGVGKPC